MIGRVTDLFAEFSPAISEIFKTQDLTLSYDNEYS
jgi:hypothetical protein